MSSLWLFLKANSLANAIPLASAESEGHTYSKTSAKRWVPPRQRTHHDVRADRDLACFAHEITANGGGSNGRDSSSTLYH